MKITNKLCERCHGSGVIEKHNFFNGSVEDIKCDECDGTGIIKNVKYTFEVPFDYDSEKCWAFSNKFYDIIRKLNLNGN